MDLWPPRSISFLLGYPARPAYPTACDLDDSSLKSSTSGDISREIMELVDSPFARPLRTYRHRSPGARAGHLPAGRPPAAQGGGPPRKGDADARGRGGEAGHGAKCVLLVLAEIYADSRYRDHISATCSACACAIIKLTALGRDARKARQEYRRGTRVPSKSYSSCGKLRQNSNMHVNLLKWICS